jgi:hypothetical protein
LSGRLKGTQSTASSQQAATHFLDVKFKASQTEYITSMLSSKQKEDIARNKQMVKEIIVCSRTISPLISILVCSVYLEMCILSSNRIRYCVIRVRLVFRRVWTHDAKLSWNPLCLRYPPSLLPQKIEISGEMVREQIVSACNDSEYFVLIGDEATDVQHMNKPSCV